VIELAYHADIAILRMAHGKANAMSIEFCRALTARLNELLAAPARAVVLTGTGRIFSAGVDLPRLIEGGVPYVREFLPALNEMLAAVFSYPKPVVAAINGHAIAGGCVLACCADYRMMARGNGRIGVTELLVGVPFPPMAFEIMRHVTPARFLHEIIFGGATFAPDHGIERGLVDEVVDAALLHERAIAAAKALAALSPAAFALMKQQVRQPVQDRLTRHGDALNAAADEIWTGPQTAERIRDYVSRTLKKA
jgi:enoyl-CoA hydratase